MAKSQASNLGPVVIFAEGVSSNGRGVLPFLPPVAPAAEVGSGGADVAGLEGQAWIKGKAPACFAAVVRYPFQYFSPTYTVGSLAAHCLLGVCWQVLCSVIALST